MNTDRLKEIGKMLNAADKQEQQSRSSVMSRRWFVRALTLGIAGAAVMNSQPAKANNCDGSPDACTAGNKCTNGNICETSNTCYTKNDCTGNYNTCDTSDSCGSKGGTNTCTKDNHCSEIHSCTTNSCSYDNLCDATNNCTTNTCVHTNTPGHYP